MPKSRLIPSILLIITITLAASILAIGISRGNDRPLDCRLKSSADQTIVPTR